MERFDHKKVGNWLALPAYVGEQVLNAALVEVDKLLSGPPQPGQQPASIQYYPERSE